MLKNLADLKMTRWIPALLAPLLLTAAVYAAEVHTPVPPAAVEEVLPAAEESPEEVLADLVFPAAEDWQLLLVNPWHMLPEEFGETLDLEVLPNGMRVDARIYEDLTEMLRDCRREGLRPLVCSAYRTQAVQTRLYRNKIARLLAAGCPAEEAAAEAARWVAYPGTSEHQMGLAVDIVAASYQVLDERQEETAEQKWLMEHCWEYGFILRYPPEKSGVTGIGYEPWHYRYVGRAAALDIQNSGLCLEEYLDLRAQALQEGGPEAADALETAPQPQDLFP